MKLLLTSAGIKNVTLANTLFKLAEKDPKDTTAVYIPTAANVELGDKDWLLEDINTTFDLGFKVFDIVDISALPQDKWLPRLNDADILFFGGGNTFHLMYWVEKSGLSEFLPEMLEKKVYVGTSAGSQIMNPVVDSPVLSNLFEREENEYDVEKGLGYVDFYIIPHMQSKWFPKLTKENITKEAQQIEGTVYALDDQSAVLVDNDKVEVVSEGTWFKV